MKNLIYLVMVLDILMFTLIDLFRILLFSIVILPFIIFKNKEVNQYIKNNYLSMDQGYNTVWGGSSDETISSRVMRYKDSNKVAFIVYKILDKIQYNHCEISLESEDRHQEDIIK